jgi:hypothetical protein
MYLWQSLKRRWIEEEVEEEQVGGKTGEPMGDGVTGGAPAV